jgi:hypothetical protein
VHLTFYRNGKSCGKAFDNIPADTYHPIVSLLNIHDNEVRVTLNTTVKEPGAVAKKPEERSSFEPPEVGKVPGMIQGSFFEKLIQ